MVVYDSSVAGGSRQVRWLSWLSVPIAAGAIVASVMGLFVPGIYEAETVNWAAQGRGQDAVNLVVYPLMLLAWRAARGSLPAFLGWVGVAAYSAYSYLLYAGWIHFGPLFLVYVATFGLSTYALIGGVAVLDPARLKAAFRGSVPHRGVGSVLAALGGLFAALWMSEIVPPLLEGRAPQTLADAGLSSNPVWVLDLGIVLPAMILAGVMLRRDRPLGFLLAAPLLVFGIVMGGAIVGMFISLAMGGQAIAPAPAIMIVLIVAFETLALTALLRHLQPNIHPDDVARPRPLSGRDEPMDEAAPEPLAMSRG